MTADRTTLETMTPAQVAAVRPSFALAFADRPRAAARFHERLFEAAPGLRPLFPASLKAQCDGLAGTLAVVVMNLHDPDVVVPGAKALALRRVGYGARPERYAVVGEVLIGTLRGVLGPALSPEAEAEAALTHAYAALAGEMIAAAEGADAAG